MTTNHQTSIASLAKKRRTYSAEFKQQIVQACKAPDVSIASVALQHGLNTNLVSKWIRLIDAKPGNDRSPLPNKPAFIVKLLYYSYKIRKKLEITHRLSRSTILYAYV